MLKKGSSLLLALVLAVTVFIVPTQAGGAINPNTGGIPGSWSPGTNPAVIDPGKPAILFVHGLNGSAASWYDNNDMYQFAYNSGYQTAYINLHDITGTSQSMWDNGQLLAAKIKEISEYFGKKLVIVAHSKGGVDTQSALVHYNAYPYVSNVITLGSPHHGSQLADLAYSSWASWLSSLVGAQNPGTYSMQTSYMAYFRSLTNNHPNAGKNKFFTFAGKDWNSGSTAHFFGGLYLSSYGANDGVVTVANAHLPNGTMVKIGNWNHSSVKQGSNTFNLLKPYLVLQTAAAKSSSLVEIASAKDKKKEETPQEEQESQSFVRGGQHDGQASETFTVENDVSSVTIDWIGDKPLHQLEIIAPDGSVHKAKVSSFVDEDVFSGAWHHTATINKPGAGEWKVSAASGEPSAYLFTVAYNTKGKNKVKLQKEQGSKKLKVKTDGLKAEKTKVTYSIDFIGKDSEKLGGKQGKKRIKQQEQQLAAVDELSIPTTEGTGVYNVTAEIEGETAEGFKYQRTVIKSVFVDEQGNTFAP
ncbi:alpha/beta hydrolase [Paenibacillus oenotherae]|uniref:Alpha/beta hydrolase n=1 Tax=Paenibacillus oenotherae TaxID=1435645 RepID=A0ABS7D9Q5_9BACL|nr:alpha/beta hydrolase [Paenibacillus oenotherae]MBW7476605.1 alpha/beta hydrolase [Paenibacillus oenotherae]